MYAYFRVYCVVGQVLAVTGEALAHELHVVLGPNLIYRYRGTRQILLG